MTITNKFQPNDTKPKKPDNEMYNYYINLGIKNLIKSGYFSLPIIPMNITTDIINTIISNHVGKNLKIHSKRIAPILNKELKNQGYIKYDKNIRLNRINCMQFNLQLLQNYFELPKNKDYINSTCIFINESHYLNDEIIKSEIENFLNHNLTFNDLSLKQQLAIQVGKMFP